MKDCSSAEVVCGVQYIAVRRCFNISHFTFIRNVLYFLATLPVKLLLEEKRLMLVKSYVFCPRELVLCGLLSMNEDNFIDVCYMYNVHCYLPKYVIKNNIRS